MLKFQTRFPPKIEIVTNGLSSESVILYIQTESNSFLTHHSDYVRSSPADPSLYHYEFVQTSWEVDIHSRIITLFIQECTERKWLGRRGIHNFSTKKILISRRHFENSFTLTHSAILRTRQGTCDSIEIHLDYTLKSRTVSVKIDSIAFLEHARILLILWKLQYTFWRLIQTPLELIWRPLRLVKTSDNQIPLKLTELFFNTRPDSAKIHSTDFDTLKFLWLL